MNKLKVIFIALLFIAVLIIGCNSNKETEKPVSKSKENKKQKTEKPKEKNFEVSSPAFNDGEAIPTKYAYKMVAGGQNISLPLEWKNIPKGTKSIAITMIDIDAGNFVHWLVININPKETSLKEGASGNDMPYLAAELKNDYGRKGYGGPAPPFGEEHEYEITVWALNSNIRAVEKLTFNEFQGLIEGKVLGKAVITGNFQQ